MKQQPDNEARELLKRWVALIKVPAGNDPMQPLWFDVKSYLARHPEPQHPAKVAFEEWWKKVEDDLPAALVNRQLSGLNRHQSERLALAFYRKGLEAAAALQSYKDGHGNDCWCAFCYTRTKILNASKEVPQ